jgi:hypothetical protein
MNSDTEILVAEILAESGAVEKCQTCFGFMIRTDDEDAEKRAYGMAINEWKSGERGFRSMEREEVVAMIKRGLTATLHKCPSCNRND